MIALGGLEKFSAATPAFVYGYSATPQGPQAAVPVTFAAAQTAGNLNVPVVGWNDTTAQAASIVDSKENTYQLAGYAYRTERRSFAVHLLRKKNRSSRSKREHTGLSTLNRTSTDAV